MARSKQIPLEVRQKIVRLRLDGKTFSEIEKETGILHQTCSRIVDRVKKSGSLHDAPRSGRPVKLSPADIRLLEREIAKNPQASLSEIVESSGLNISVCSIYRYRKQLRLYIQLRSLQSKPWLDRKKRRQRLKFCHANRSWNRMDTRNRIWSDETAVQIHTFHQRKVWCKIGSKKQLFRPSFPTTKLTLHFWAAITYNDRTPLIFIRRRTPAERKHPKDRLGMNSDQYIHEVLQPHFLPFWKRIGGQMGGLYFMQDGAGPHASKKTFRFLQRNRIQLQPWPGNSPDLNPIENAWHLLKARLRKRFRDPRKRPHTEAEWIKAAQEEWEQIPQEVLNRLVDSVPRRFAACIKARGGHTKY